MIHQLAVLPAGAPAVAHGAKAGSAALIAALFGDALNAQLQATEPGLVANAQAGLLPVAAAGKPLLAPGISVIDQIPGEIPELPLGVEVLAEAADPLAGVAVDDGKTPISSTAEEAAEPARTGLIEALLGLGANAVAPVATGLAFGKAAEPPVATGPGFQETEVATLPASLHNPLASIDLKNLPLTPAGLAADAHAFNAGEAGLPEAVIAKLGLPPGLEGKVMPPGLEVKQLPPGLDGKALLPGMQGLMAGDAPLLEAVAKPENPPSTLATSTSATPALPVQLEAPGQPVGTARQAVQILAPFNRPQWQVEFGEKVVWLLGRQAQVAEVSLNPPSLGGIEVRLNMSGQEAGAQFFSPNPVVRDALESALPKLRDMLAEAGVALGEATVSSEPFRERPDAEPSANARAAESESGTGSTQGTARVSGWTASGLVDLYV
jgi:flagellar hook-length control protein FliK